MSVFFSVFFRLKFTLLMILCITESILINSSEELVKLLCSGIQHQDLSITLNSSIQFSLSNFSKNTCNVYSSSLILQSSSSDIQALLTCKANSSILSQPNFGLSFNDSKVFLKNIAFLSCGSFIKYNSHSIVTRINSSKVHYTEEQVTVLLFVNCHVEVSQLRFKSSLGFSIVGINIKNSSFNFIEIVNSTFHSSINHKPMGAGILLHFMDLPDSNSSSTTVRINNYHSQYNSNFFQHSCIRDVYSSVVSEVSVLNAIGLTILYTQNDFNARVILSDSLLSELVGYVAGGILIIHYHSSSVSKTYIQRTRFQHLGSLTPQCNVGCIGLYTFLSNNSHPLSNVQLHIDDSSFVGNHQYVIFGEGVHVYVEYNNERRIILNLRNTSFTNFNSKEGCLIVESQQRIRKFTILLSDIFAKDNLMSEILLTASLFSFENINNVNLLGNSEFNHNRGSVIRAINTDIHLKGRVVFSDNSATSGAAILAVQSSRIFFAKEARTFFFKNHAEDYGGSICITDFRPYQRKRIFGLTENHGRNVATFSQNFARKSGNSIFIAPLSPHLRNCKDNVLTLFRHHFKFLNPVNNNLYEISTNPIRLARKLIGMMEFYPGQTLSISLTAKDISHRNVFTLININVAHNSRLLWISFNQQVQLLQEGVNNSVVEVTLFSRSSSPRNGTLIIFSKHVDEVQDIKIHAKSCPIGFKLNASRGICECSPVVLYLWKETSNNSPKRCFIQNQTILFPKEINGNWAGIVRYGNNSTTFGFSLSCPTKFCRSGKKGLYYSTDENIYRISGTNFKIPMCIDNRQGVLCGKCREGYSVMFSSVHCSVCSDNYLWTILLYLIIGPLFIAVLFGLDLTLSSGTMNGIIFYAQLSHIGIIDLLDIQVYERGFLAKLSVFFLSIMNNNLTPPLCFYNGMDELWKSGLSLLFPLYQLLLVMMLIIGCKFSVWLSNKIANSSVQVLVTVLHLSFSRLLLAIINVFTWSIVYTEQQNMMKVWFLDGEVGYFSHRHLILVIVTMMIVAPLLLIYVGLLTFSNSLRKFKLGNKYLKPLIEAIHAPYRQGREQWFTARIMLLIILYSVYAVYRSKNAFIIYRIAIPTLVLFIIVQAYRKPFKSKFINIMDCTLMYNFALLGMTTWYYLAVGEDEVVALYASISVSIVFFNFICVLIYHFLVVSKSLKIILQFGLHYLNKLQMSLFMAFHRGHMSTDHEEDSIEHGYGSFTNSSENNYREPLLSSIRQT